jgi:hypothetical protein
MCRNIRVLHHFQPPTTPEEIRAAAEQYVRKVGGIRSSKPAKGDVDAIERAVDAVVNATTKLLDTLPARGEARTREGERERAKARWESREERMKRDLLGGPKATAKKVAARTVVAKTVAAKTVAAKTVAKTVAAKTGAAKEVAATKTASKKKAKSATR